MYMYIIDIDICIYNIYRYVYVYYIDICICIIYRHVYVLYIYICICILTSCSTSEIKLCHLCVVVIIYRDSVDLGLIAGAAS